MPIRLLLLLSITLAGGCAAGGQDLGAASEDAQFSRDAAAAARVPGDSLVLELSLRRLEPGMGPVLVTSGVVLPPGAIRGDPMTTLRLEVDTATVAAHFEPLTSRRRDGSLRSLLVQFEADLPPRAVATAKLIVGTVRPSPAFTRREPLPGPPRAVLYLAAPDTLVSLDVFGPTVHTITARRWGGAFAAYEALFDKAFAYHESPTSLTAADRNNNYYDRAEMYYIWWARTGDVKYLNRAHEVLLWYRQDMVEKNGGGTVPQWALPEGLELHYLLTGDTLSRRAIASIYAHGLDVFRWRHELDKGPYTEGRIQARVLQGALSAWRVQASYTRPDGIQFPASDWPNKLRDIVNQIMASQNPDGSFSYAPVCGGQLNYMVGMVTDALIQYHRDFEADPRILPFIKKAYDYLWATQWQPATKSFAYASVNCSGVGSPYAAPDLNGLIVNGFGWLYKQTGDPTYRQRGDLVLQGLVEAGMPTGSKQYNQYWAFSHRYLYLRQ